MGGSGGTDWTLVIAAGALFLTFLSVVALPVMRWLVDKWRQPYLAERDLRRRREDELLESEKARVLMEVKLDYCEGRLRGQGDRDPEGDRGAGEARTET